MKTANRTAIWFSRHALTHSQRTEIYSRFDIILEVPQLSNISINSTEFFLSVLSELRSVIKNNNACAIFGVFPTPIASCISGGSDEGTIPCYASWNIQRSILGEKPTFEHHKFLIVGHLNVD